MVSKRSVIGMLLDGHNLNGIVPIFFHTGEDVLPELIVGADSFFFGGHAHVRLIDEEGRSVGPEAGCFEPILVFRLPYLRTEYIGVLVLHHPVAPCRNTFSKTTFPADMKLVKIFVMNAVSRELPFPNAILHLFQPK